MKKSNDSYWEWMREDAELFRSQQWELKEFRSVPALFTHDGEIARKYHGEAYNQRKFELREAGWDHEHCRFCNTCICDANDDHLKAAYTNESDWLCPTCYQRIIIAKEDPQDVLDERKSK